MEMNKDSGKQFEKFKDYIHTACAFLVYVMVVYFLWYAAHMATYWPIEIYMMQVQIGDNWQRKHSQHFLLLQY